MRRVAAHEAIGSQVDASDASSKPRPRAAAAAQFRRALRIVHMLAGLSAGLVLAVMGLSGATMAFEEEIMRALSPGVVTTPVRAAPALTPEQLGARFIEQQPGAKLLRLYLYAEPGRAVRIMFEPADGALESDRLYVDPYDGEILGHANGEAFFRDVRLLHRFMLLPGGEDGIGRHITGVAAFGLIFLALTGLYLRWPARPLSLRLWLAPNLRARGRGLLWSLHTVMGTWVLLVYLTCALTGLTWAYDWYERGFRATLAGAPTASAASAPLLEGPSVGLDGAWEIFRRQTDNQFSAVIIRLPARGDDVSFRYLDSAPAHAHAYSEFVINRRDGAIRAQSDYDASSLGQQIVSGTLGFHRGNFLGILGTIAFALAAALLPFFFLTGLIMQLGRPKGRRL